MRILPPYGQPELPHANTRAAGAPHALLHAHRVKTARTSPRECFTPPCLCSLTLCNNTLTHARAVYALRVCPRPEKTAALQHK